jgi:hypothetical protein
MQPVAILSQENYGQSLLGGDVTDVISYLRTVRRPQGPLVLRKVIKQLIILFPNLWAGAEMARRKEQKKKSGAATGSEECQRGEEIVCRSFEL